MLVGRCTWQSGGVAQESPQHWKINTVDGAHVRLRSGRIGLVSIDATAPVSGGELVLGDPEVVFRLRLDIQQMRTGNFLMQAAARSLVSSNGVYTLDYEGRGTAADAGWRVSGTAVGGTIEVPLDLVISAIGPSSSPLSEIDITGSASVGTVHIPLPGLGKVDDFGFDVEARLGLVLQHP